MKRKSLLFSSKDSENTSPLKSIKAKVYSFQNLFRNKYKKQIVKSQIQRQNQQIFSFGSDYCLKPKLRSKKIMEDPKFFVSVQRKKIKSLKNYDYESAFNKKLDQKIAKKINQNKIHAYSIDRIRNNKSQMKRSTSPFFQSKRPLKQSRKSTSYLNSTKNNFECNEILQISKQVRNKTPNLNYNMQYLIKKKKLAPNSKKCKKVSLTNFMSEQLSPCSSN